MRRPLRLRTGGEWQLSILPSQEYRERTRAYLARILMGTGMLISILGALVVHFKRSDGSRARALSLARIRSLEGREVEARELTQTLEAKVQERTEELQQSVHELETFNYSISHDLRSPLGAILNYSAILNEDYRDRLDEAGRQCLDRIASCAKVAVNMMDSLLSFSRIGREKMTFEALKVEDLVRRVYPEVQALHESPTARVTIGKLPDCSGDRAMIRTVLENYLSNAFKFSRKTAAPAIEVGGYDSEDECVYFVRDNGVGFDMKDAEKLFGVFERMHSAPEFKGPRRRAGHRASHRPASLGPRLGGGRARRGRDLLLQRPQATETGCARLTSCSSTTTRTTSSSRSALSGKRSSRTASSWPARAVRH